MIGVDERLTRTLRAVRDGDTRAVHELMPMIYDHLRALARAQMAMHRPGQTLQPTALVHEAYMRLIAESSRDWEGRAHFFAAAALAMRHILIDRAKARRRLKRGGDRLAVPLDGAEVDDRSEAAFADEPPPDEVLAVHEAVGELEAEDPRKGQIVNLRYFCGMTVEETAGILGVSIGTIEREWRFIRAYLRSRLGDGALRT